MEKKYELIDETVIRFGKTLHRIKALKDFNDVKKGDLGGFIESERNLSHDGNCWVYNDAFVVGFAQVFNNAKLYNESFACDFAKIYDDVEIVEGEVYDEAIVFGNAKITNKAKILYNAAVFYDVDTFDIGTMRSYSYCGSDCFLNFFVKF